MKNLKFLGVIALVAIIGFSMAACGGNEEEKGSSTLAFNSALYGSWNPAGEERGNILFRPADGLPADVVTFVRYTTVPAFFSLTAKNGNTYTVYDGTNELTLVFTAVVGSDGKLTISGLTDLGSGWELSDQNGTNLHESGLTQRCRA